MKKTTFAVLTLLAFTANLIFFTSIANAEDRRIIFINNSSSKICHFQASNTNQSIWEEDILGQRVLRPGQKVLINLDDGSGNCYFDFKTTTCDGESIIKESVNVCKIETYTINDE